MIPKNPFIADWMIKTALQNKYQTEIDLAPLEDSLADRARAAMLKRLEINWVPKIETRSDSALDTSVVNLKIS